MRGVASLVVIAGMGVLSGCRPPQPQRLVDPACGRQCEQIYWACQATCPKDLGGSIGCTMATCGPARQSCLATCPSQENPDAIAYQRSHDQDAFGESWQRFTSRLDGEQRGLLRAYLVLPNSTTRAALDAKLDAQSRGDVANLSFAIEHDRLPVSRRALIDSVSTAPSSPGADYAPSTEVKVLPPCTNEEFAAGCWTTSHGCDCTLKVPR